MSDDRHEQLAGIGAGVAAVIGAALPWAKVTTVFGTITMSGTDGNGDGWITAVLGGAGAIAMYRMGKALWLAAVCGALIGLIGAYDMNNLRRTVADVNAESDSVIASVGIGLWVTTIAGIGLCVIALNLAVRLRRQAQTSTRLAPGSPLPPPTIG